MIEDLTHKQLCHGVFRSVKALEAAAPKCLDERNTDAKPFAWAADPDIILEKVAKNHPGTSKLGR